MLFIPRRCPSCNQCGLVVKGTDLVCEKCSFYNRPLSHFQTLLVWASSRTWWWRVPLLVWFGVVLIQNWHNPWFAVDRASNPLSGLDLGIHELGHILFIP